MCGIVGLYRWPQDADVRAAHIRNMCQTIVHRGPDDDGMFVEADVALGMRRLSIIDVEGGRQPVANEDGRVVVVFNGELYNYAASREDLRRRGHVFRTLSDTEVIVHAYEENGTDCVKEFNGIYAFALWDATARRLFVARDRMGVKPLYYVRVGKGLAFASEIKALLQLPEVPRRLDPEGVAEFFRFGFVSPPRTLFQGIRKLPPGWRLIAERDRLVVEQYWDLEFREPERARGAAEYSEELRHLLKQVVKDQMVSDVPLGAFLSGGVDSSGIVAMMCEATGAGVRTYSVGWEGADAYHNEAPYAEAVARDLGTRHQTLIVRPNVAELMPALIEKLDEPLTDTSFLVTHLVAALARKEVKVALSGVGGDELFGGYRRYLAPALASTAMWLPRGVRRVAGGSLAGLVRADRGSRLGNLGRYAKALGRTLHLPLGEQYLGLISVLSPDHVAALLRSDKNSADPGAEFVALFDRAPATHPVDRLLYVDAKTVLPESLLLLTDKMGMAASVEVRVPFLDNRVVDFVCRVPARYRLSGLRLKRLLKSALIGVVPDFVLRRPKRGFGTPMGAWVRRELQPLVAEVLDEHRLRRDGLLDPRLVREIVTSHQAGREDYSEAITALLTFEIWRERFRVAGP